MRVLSSLEAGASILYQEHLGVERYPLKTQDIDFLIPFPFHRKHRIDLVKELEALGFRHDFRPDGSIYLWNAELRIDFLIPERGRGMARGAAIPSLGLTATPLRFVNLLLQHPISVKEGGINVVLPNPTAFCLHKLLIAGRRKFPESRIKDLEQALHVVPILQPSAVKRIFFTLPNPWKRAITQALERATHDVPLRAHEVTVLLDTLHSLKKSQR